MNREENREYCGALTTGALIVVSLIAVVVAIVKAIIY